MAGVGGSDRGAEPAVPEEELGAGFAAGGRVAV